MTARTSGRVLMFERVLQNQDDAQKELMDVVVEANGEPKRARIASNIARSGCQREQRLRSPKAQ